MKSIRNILHRARTIAAKTGQEIMDDRAPGKIRLGLGLAGVGAGVYSYSKGNEMAERQAKIDHESLLALKRIHKALEAQPIQSAGPIIPAAPTLPLN